MKTKASNTQPQRSTVRAQVVEKPFTVLVVLNDLLAAVSPGHQVIDGPLEFDPQSSGHPASGAHGSDGVNEKPKTKSDPGGIDGSDGVNEKPKTKSDPGGMDPGGMKTKSDPGGI